MGLGKRRFGVFGGQFWVETGWGRGRKKVLSLAARVAGGRGPIFAGGSGLEVTGKARDGGRVGGAAAFQMIGGRRVALAGAALRVPPDTGVFRANFFTKVILLILFAIIFEKARFFAVISRFFRGQLPG